MESQFVKARDFVSPSLSAAGDAVARSLPDVEAELASLAQRCQASGFGLQSLADTEFIDQRSAYRKAHSSPQVLFARVGRRKGIESNDPVEQFVAFERHDFLIEAGKILSATQFSLGCHGASLRNARSKLRLVGSNGSGVGAYAAP